jgi:hypothetical protein
MRIERPPELWEADTEDIRLVPLLGEMIAAGLGTGVSFATLSSRSGPFTKTRAPDFTIA